MPEVPQEYQIEVVGEVFGNTPEEVMQRTAFELLARSYGSDADSGFDGSITVNVIVAPPVEPVDPDDR